MAENLRPKVSKKAEAWKVVGMNQKNTNLINFNTEKFDAIKTK